MNVGAKTVQTRRAAEHGAPAAAEVQRLLAELLGTFLLTLVAAGGGVIGAVSGQVALPAAVVAPALLVMAMIYAVGDLSGAHFNPAVTLAFAVRRDFPWRYVPGYWLAQLIGAILAALLLRALFGDVGALGATLPHHGLLTSWVMEIVLTAMLVTVILNTAVDHRLVGHNAALAVAGMISLTGLFAAPISGASMNPARSFGPALVGGHLDVYWIYLAGPVLGALVAVGIAVALRGDERNHYEEAAALGALHPTWWHEAPAPTARQAHNAQTARETG